MIIDGFEGLNYYINRRYIRPLFILHDDYVVCSAGAVKCGTLRSAPTAQSSHSQDKHKKPAQHSPNQISPTCFCSYSVNWQPHHWYKLQINPVNSHKWLSSRVICDCRFLDDIVTRLGPAMQAIKCVVVGDGAVGEWQEEENCQNNKLNWNNPSLLSFNVLTNIYYR